MTKSASEDFIAAEEAIQRKPGELYRFWTDIETQYYTDGDVDIVYDGNTYIRASLSRGSSEYNSNLQESRLAITAGRITEPLVEYIRSNPIETVWVEISKLHRDQSPLETMIVFVGLVLNVTFKGPIAQVNCVGLEHFLKQAVPKFRYQITCNYVVYDTACGVSSADYKTTTNVTVSDNGQVLTSADFGTKPDGYFRRGFMEFGNYKRLITEHSGNDVTLRYAIPGLETGNSVNAYAGCDGHIETCRDKFDNILQFFGMPYIPKDNPTLWVPVGGKL